MVETKAQKVSMLLMLTCASLWSIAGIFIKLIPWNPLVIAGFRSLIAAGIVLLYMRYIKQKIVVNKASILAGVMLTLTFLAFVTANKFTTAANAIVLQFTCPVFILIISAIFFRQKLRIPDILAVVFTLAGISLFFLGQFTPGSLLGNCIAILSGLFLAGMYITTSRADDAARISGILLGHLFTAAVGIPMAFFYPTPVTPIAVVSVVVLGVFQLGIPYILYGIAVKNCPPLACSLLGAVEPLLNPVWVFLFMGEAPSAFALIGGVIVIAAVTLWCILRDKVVKA